MVNLHKGDGYNGDAFSVRNGPGIRYVQFLVEDAQKPRSRTSTSSAVP